jgi:hypothetical protein
MSWPLASHFSAVLQNPRVAFRDPQLQRWAVEKNEQGQPRPWAGAFAVVYKALDPEKGPFAVRVFTTESPERRERYDLISAYLKGRKLNCLVDFEYRDRSIRSAGDGKWYPVILMDWVQGETLFKWVRACCLAGNVAALAQAADHWVEAVRELADAQIAHGDLQHANVMVTPAGELKLVDYDGMCVPALVGRRNLEIGVEPYQHPDRNPTTLLSLDLDNFSALMIYVALRALAVNPNLWLRYVEPQGHDKLLFRREDLQYPERSPLYADLLSLGSDVRDLAEQLFAFARAPMEEVPPLTQLVGSYAKVERLLRARQWNAAVDLLNRRGHFRDAPEQLRPLIHEAYEHVCRQRAWDDFCKIPGDASEEVDRLLVEKWNEPLFAGFAPAEEHRMRVAEARKRVGLLDRLRHFVQRTAGQITVSGEKSLVAAAGQLPQGYPHSLQRRVELARRRVTALARLERALADPDSEAAIVAAWRAVVEAKCEQLVSLDWGMRIGLAEERVPVLQALAEMPRGLPSDERDRRILELWREDLLKDCREAERWQPAYQRAAARKKIYDQIQAAIQSHNELKLAKLADQQWLEKYTLPDGWMPAMKAARERVGRLETMLKALREASRRSAGETPAGDNNEEATDTTVPDADEDAGETTTLPPPAFREAFDVRLVRDYADRFARYQTLLANWIRGEILPLDKLGLQAVPEQKGLTPVDDPQGNLRVEWVWPPEGRADRCILAVCPTEPGPDADPETVTTHWRETMDREQWTAGGCHRLIMAERPWEGSSVVVWAVLDAGFQTFYSPPLVLGRIESRSRWGWMRIFSRRAEPSPLPSGEG